jgi:hypothetical protein
VKVPEPLQPLKKDETITVEVVVESNPKPTVAWSLNGKELTAKDGVKIGKDLATNTYSLTILKLNSSVHAGAYTVTATNSIATSKHQFNLDILGYCFSCVFFLLCRI